MNLQHSEGERSDEVLTPVRFYVKREAIDKLLRHAAELDDADLGEHLAEYTVPQALLVVFHSDPEFLFKEHILDGWTFDPNNNDDLWRGVQWVPEGTPEDHVIEEDPL